MSRAAGFRRKVLFSALAFFAGCLPIGRSAPGRLGPFEGQTDVGQVQIKGAVEALPAPRTFRLTGSGENMWGASDAFHYVWRRASGDLVLETDVAWEGAGKNPHRKAGSMVRQGIEADAPYADAVAHGNGLISLQYRLIAGGPTAEIQCPSTAPARLRLERQGDLFTLSVSRKGGGFQPVGSITVALRDPVYAGVFVCSHEPDLSETAILSNVDVQNLGVAPPEKRVLESTLETLSIETGERKIVHRARTHFEAPNWSRDGRVLLFNGQGRLYTIPIEGGEPKALDTGSATRCNNDHGFSFDGKWLAISHSPAKQPSLVYVLPSSGGEPRLVTKQGPSYWHGWSPDGKTLAYCAERNKEFDVYTIPVEGGNETRLTDAPGLDDGPEYSPDGRFIYFNSERGGSMKIWRMKADGSAPEQVTQDAEFADWFAHPSPDGKWLVFLSYDRSVQGHPENKDVALRIMPIGGGKPKILARLFGGQGTINVPSWSPDSRSFAFVSYALVRPQP
jgi:hypothetical protein